MHFRAAIRQELVRRLAGAHTNIVLHDGEAHRLGEDAFLEPDGQTPRYHIIVGTPDLRPTSPQGEVFVGVCEGPEMEIPVELGINIQIIIALRQGTAEGMCDEIEEAIWPRLVVDALDIAAADGLLLEFAGEVTEAASGNTEVALMTRSLRFTVVGSFRPADPTVLFAQAT